MRKRILRGALIGVDALVAASAVGGGVELVFGLNRSVPMSWLHGTPFSDFTVPGLILGIVVGGSATFATLAAIKSADAGAAASLIAGAILSGWIVGEVLLLNQPHPTWIEVTYFSAGVGMAVMAIVLAPRRWRPGGSFPREV
jgi:hypothetical protein